MANTDRLPIIFYPENLQEPMQINKPSALSQLYEHNKTNNVILASMLSEMWEQSHGAVSRHSTSNAM